MIDGTTESPSPESLAHPLRSAVVRLSRTLRSQSAEKSITPSQFSLLATLVRDGPISAGDLATGEGIQPPSLSRVLSHLEQRGLVQRTKPPTDRRQAVIQITGNGRAVLDAERQSGNALLSYRLSRLTQEERAALIAALPLLDRLARR